MKQYIAGEVILVLFPFTDGAGAKRRPALVLLDAGDEDIVVDRITSQIVQTVFDVQLVDWQKASLLFPSIVRVHKVATLEKRLVERTLGRLTRRDWAQIRGVVRRLWTSV
jgi:mRNA interferase MazF